jgi:diguanylate cyclase (GGDEF)-like protein/PAS domain S-box-containing protein
LRLDHVERFSRAVTDGVPGATVIVFDCDLRILLCDGALYGRHGADPAAFVGRQIVDVVPAESWRRLRPHYRAALAGERRSFEYRTVDDTASFWLHLSPFHDEEGAVVGGVLVSQDITDRIEEGNARQAEIEHTAAAFTDAPIGMAALDSEGRFLRVNPSLCRMLRRTADELLGTTYREYIHPDELEESAADFVALRSGRSTHESERRYVRADGSVAWGLVSTTPLRPVAGRPWVIFAQVQDVTERRRAESHLRRRLAQQSAVAELGRRALEGEPLSELRQRATAVTKRALGVEITSYLELAPEAEDLRLVAGEGWRRGELGHLRVPLGLDSGAGFALQSGQAVVSRDLRHERRFDPALLLARGIESSVLTIVGEPEHPLGILGAYSREPTAFAPEDVHFVQAVANVLAETIERRNAEARMRHSALHDPLTGLPNRPHFLSCLESALANARDQPSRVGVFLIDVDDFKAVNDSLGHHAGDALLGAIAARLREVVRGTDLIGRFGGDEFAVLSPTLRGERQVHDVAERLLGAFARPFEIEGEYHYAQASVGVVVAHESSREPEILLRDADAAMYRAKDRGRNRYELLTEQVRARTVDRLKMRSELRRALVRGELRIHYQPFFVLGDLRPAGAEALLRWEHPERGLLGPAEFLPVAEESGLIVALGEWVLREACMQAVHWREQLGDGPFLLTVNVAARQVAGGSLPDVVRDALSRAGLTADALGLEVTEGALIDAHADSTLALEALKDVGVRLLLDDFGMGFSSLSRLKRLPIDVVKIDRSFVDQVALPESHDSAIVQAIMGMARALDMDVIAEGVETEEQVASLRDLGCRVAQGYLFARPQPAADVDRLVAAAIAA